MWSCVQCWGTIVRSPLLLPQPLLVCLCGVAGHHLPFKTSQCAKHHRTSHCVLISHWSAIFWIEHVWLVFLSLLLLILFELLFSNGRWTADKICLPKCGLVCSGGNNQKSVTIWLRDVQKHGKLLTNSSHARQQLALAVQWGCKDYYDDIGKRQATHWTFYWWFLLIIVEILLWLGYSCLKLKEILQILLGLFGTQ